MNLLLPAPGGLLLIVSPLTLANSLCTSFIPKQTFSLRESLDATSRNTSLETTYVSRNNLSLTL